MEALLISRVLLPAQNWSYNSSPPSRDSLSRCQWRPSRILRTPCSSCSLSLNPNSRYLNARNLGGNGLRVLAWRQRRSESLARRAVPDGVDPVNLHSDAYVSKDAKENQVQSLLQVVASFISTNFLITVLLLAIVLALAWPVPGQAAQRMGLTKWCTSFIFVLSGLNLRSEEIGRAATAWPAGFFGLVSILLITPLAAIPILAMKSTPRELVVGLAIFACVPTTLSSAVSMTQVAGANATLALGMTVVSNLISIVTMPFTLTKFVGAGIGVSIPPGPLLRSLIETLLLPLFFGKVLRESLRGVAKFVDGHRRQVSVFGCCILGLVPWMQLSSSKGMLLQVEPHSLLIVGAASLAMHVVYLATNSVLMRLCPSPCIHDDYNSRAVLLVSSQKSLLVAVSIIDRLGGAFGNSGLLVLPCIVAQLTQVVWKTLLTINCLLLLGLAAACLFFGYVSRILKLDIVV